MSELTLGKPNDKQRKAMLARQRHVGFGGARGGGKSWMIQTKSIAMCERYPGIRITIIRQTYPELEENHIQVMRPLLLGYAKYNQQQKRFTFPNGSTIKFNYCKNDADADNFRGQEYDVIFFDEATDLSENQMKRIGASCRGTNDFPKRIYYTCNPGGQGHEYIKRIFVDRVYEDGENPDDYFFVQSLLSDNAVLMRKDPEYKKYLEGLPEKLRRAWLLGEWDVFEGQFFEEFRVRPDRIECERAGLDAETALRERRFTHVIEPFEIPKTWEIFRSFDFGYAKPFSCDWWAVDYDGRAYLFLQWYGCTEPNEGLKITPQEMFPRIEELERTHPALAGRRIHGVADPSIWDASRGPSTAEIAALSHVYFEPGDNARLPGWMQCHYRMAFDEQGYPMVYFFNTCKHAIRTIPLMVYSETVPEDLDTDMEDHFCDSMRYFFMMRPIQPRMIKPGKAYTPDPLDMRVRRV